MRTALGLVVIAFGCGERRVSEPAPVAPPAVPATADAMSQAPQTQAGALQVRARGALAQDLAEPAIRSHLDELDTCLGAQPRLAADIDIGANGRVTLVRSPILGALASVGECITHRARAWTFPAAAGPTKISVIYTR